MTFPLKIPGLLKSKTTPIPTFILLGDSIADGRGNVGATSGDKYFSEYATDIINADKATVKIFDNVGGSDTFVTLNKTNAQVVNVAYNFGVEQTLMWELAQQYGATEIRIIKQALGSTFAGIPIGSSSTNSWQPTYQQMLNFETTYANAVSAAATEGYSLDIIGVISILGTNDATELATSLAIETNLTTIINHIRNNVINKQAPFIVCSPAEGTTYFTNVDTGILSLVGNVSNTYYANIYKYERGVVHASIAGIFGIGLEIAEEILTDILLAPSIAAKYGFKFSTNHSGSYDILTRMLVDMTDYYIDWGDGNQTLVTTNNMTWNHVYADATTKEISINCFTPWNLITLYLNPTLLSNIVGTFDLSVLTGLDSFNTTGANTSMTSIIPPINNYNFYVALALKLMRTSGLTSFNYSRYKDGDVDFTDNASLNSWIDTSTGKAHTSKINWLNNDLITEYDISNFSSTGVIYCRNHNILSTFIHHTNLPISMVAEMLMSGNTSLTTITNFEGLIYATYCDFNNNNLTVAQVDAIINEMWARCQDTAFYYNSSSKQVFLQLNQGYSGVFDGTTDWSGGLPTSPGAKAYDMLNDVTGIYNFITFQLT